MDIKLHLDGCAYCMKEQSCMCVKCAEERTAAAVAKERERWEKQLTATRDELYERAAEIERLTQRIDEAREIILSLTTEMRPMITRYDDNARAIAWLAANRKETP